MAATPPAAPSSDPFPEPEQLDRKADQASSAGAGDDPAAATARLEAAVDEAIDACDGDPRAAVRALIVANDYLEQELCALFAAVSRGYARGRLVSRERGGGRTGASAPDT